MQARAYGRDGSLPSRPVGEVRPLIVTDSLPRWTPTRRAGASHIQALTRTESLPKVTCRVERDPLLFHFCPCMYIRHECHTLNVVLQQSATARIGSRHCRGGGRDFLDILSYKNTRIFQ